MLMSQMGQADCQEPSQSINYQIFIDSFCGRGPGSTLGGKSKVLGEMNTQLSIVFYSVQTTCICFYSSSDPEGRHFMGSIIYIIIYMRMLVINITVGTIY